LSTVGQQDGIEQAAVEAWFEANVPGAKPPLRFERVAGGRSNLTFKVSDSENEPFVLRRPPLGKRLGSAHDMSREYRCIDALQGTDVPVPKSLAMCEDESVTGAPFYVMSFVEGRIVRSQPDAENLDEPTRRRIGEDLVDTLVAIHAVDPDAVGLGDLGRKEDYVARQLKRWAGQWEKSKTRELPLMEDVHRRLQARIPDQGPATIVHGDYRLDNTLLLPDGTVAAVLDWELCTLGDPLADVGLLHVYWSEPDDPMIPLFDAATMLPGFSTRAELMDRYAQRSGRDLTELDFYVALGFWKLAAILEGVLARQKAGGYGEDAARDAGLDQMAKMVEGLAQAADEAERRLDR
jgi:aminoglycoside phosphotransferase (APT) family kinase protein